MVLGVSRAAGAVHLGRIGGDVGPTVAGGETLCEACAAMMTMTREAAFDEKSHDESIVIVSDFHLSSGSGPQGDGSDPFEIFHHDGAFARFLDFVRHRDLAPRRRCRLVILGDLFDFPRVRLGSARITGNATDATAVAKLERIAAGHPAFFSALARFLNDGGLLDIVPGNHDTELMRPSVIERFRSQLTAAGAEPDRVVTISVHPWILSIPGLLYAEHGQQYHDINTLPALLGLAGAPETARDRPIGAALDEYVLDLLEAIDRDRGHVGSTIIHPGRALRRRPALVLKTLPIHARFAWSLFRESVRSSDRWRPARREGYREAFIRPQAAEIGLSYETLVAIDQLAATAAAGFRLRVARALVVRPLMTRLAQTRRLMVRRADDRVSEVPSDAAGDAADLPSPAAQRSRYLDASAAAIHHILAAHAGDVPFYVFGHTHRAESLPLSAVSATPCYLNCGSWTVRPRIPPGAGSPRDPFTFVDIGRTAGGDPYGRLMMWNDAAGRAEPVPTGNGGGAARRS